MKAVTAIKAVPWRSLSSAVLMLAVAFFLAVLAHFAGNRWVVLESVRIEGGDTPLRARVAALLQPLRGRSLLALDLNALKAHLENVAGAGGVHLRRVLPDTLHVGLEKHRPLARWDGGGMIDIYGRRYAAVAVAGDLPIFKGQEGSARNMTEFYGDAVGIFGGGIVQLELSKNGDWTVFLRDGLVLYLGGDSPRRKLRLYSRYARSLRQRFPDMRAIDLRNERGFTVVNGDGKEEKNEKHA